MKCKDIEGLLIESSGKKLDKRQFVEIERHAGHCARCARFKEDLENIRSVLGHMPRPTLPEDLDNKTYQMCKAEMASFKVEGKVFGSKAWFKSIPAFMKVAFICLIVLTAVWAILLFKDFSLGESLSAPTIVILFLIIQNALMLLFAPLLLRRFRSKNPGMHTIDHLPLQDFRA